jgi:hypothetical protein
MAALRRYMLSLVSVVAVSAFSQTASAQVFITEWMYNGNGATGEYIEFTNLGTLAVDFTGWSFDDDSRAAGTVSLSSFGVVNPGESVILTEATVADFRAVWSLAESVRVIGSNATNLGRSDEINLFDSANQLVDRLTYSDQNFPGTIRAQNASGNPTSLTTLGSPYDPYGWVLAVTGDIFGSYIDINGVDIGNPGRFALAPPVVPLPAAAWLLMSGLAGLVGVARRKRAV